VSGVYLRLFTANPSWVVRQPRQFASGLMERVVDELAAPSSHLEVITAAAVALFRHQPGTADQLPAQGYLPQFCKAMAGSNGAACRSVILILQQLAENTLCVEALSKLECIAGIQTAMKQRPELMHEAAHALSLLLRSNSNHLVEQMLSTGMVEYLLEVLGNRLDGVQNPAAAKAEIVQTLKTITLNLEHGQRVQKLLDNCKAWAQFRDQRHDLFLAPTPRADAITGPIGVAGYLTDGLFNAPNRQFVPPPVNK